MTYGHNNSLAASLEILSYLKDHNLNGEVLHGSNEYIAKRINDFNPTAKKPFVLGLPTGSTPLGTYNELIKLYEAGKVSFEHVVTFNMDEYVGLPEEHPQSYHRFMWDNFFSKINIRNNYSNKESN